MEVVLVIIPPNIRIIAKKKLRKKGNSYIAIIMMRMTMTMLHDLSL